MARSLPLLGCRALLEQALQHGSLQEVAALAGDEQLQEYCNAVVGLVQVRGHIPNRS
jgi:hypothetical protein